MMIYIYLAFGGAAGALARFGIGVWALRVGGPAFPWGTLLVNVSGSFLLGFLMQALPGSDVSHDMRALLTVGFCGSFTTFSAFGYEAVLLWQSGSSGWALAYVGASVTLGILAVLCGLWAAG